MFCCVATYLILPHKLMPNFSCKPSSFRRQAVTKQRAFDCHSISYIISRDIIAEKCFSTSIWKISWISNYFPDCFQICNLCNTFFFTFSRTFQSKFNLVRVAFSKTGELWNPKMVQLIYVKKMNGKDINVKVEIYDICEFICCV